MFLEIFSGFFDIFQLFLTNLVPVCHSELFSRFSFLKNCSIIQNSFFHIFLQLLFHMNDSPNFKWLRSCEKMLCYLGIKLTRTVDMSHPSRVHFVMQGIRNDCCLGHLCAEMGELWGISFLNMIDMKILDMLLLVVLGKNAHSKVHSTNFQLRHSVRYNSDFKLL